MKQIQLILLSSLLFQGSVNAESWFPGLKDGNFDVHVLLYFAGAFALLLLVQSILTSTIKNLSGLADKEEKAFEAKNTVELPFWKKLNKLLTRSVPVEEEEDVMMDHEYDGIRELDNQLPPWWKWGFVATIVFSFAYMIYYHMSNAGLSSHEEYMVQMEQAEIAHKEYLEKMAGLIDENTVTVLTDQDALNKGQEIYKQYCAACHGQQGEGGVGPNFADRYWLHGGGIQNVFKTIKYGVPSKGMISWKAQLKPQQIQEVSSYILSIQGTNPPNAKEPQGELWEDTGVSADSLSTNTDVIKSTEGSADEIVMN